MDQPKNVLGEPLEPWSIVGFLLNMSIPAFTFTLALVFLISLLAKNRLVTAVAVLVVLVAYFWILFRIVPIDIVVPFGNPR